MMSTDDLVKIVLIFSIAFAIIAVSLQLSRLLAKLVEVVEDLRHPIKNINELSDLVLADYKSVRGNVVSVTRDLKTFANVFSNPAGAISRFLKIVKLFNRKG